ncbi:MAG: nucleotidyltransferase domain-containing protein [Microlunatus sp.]|nr:nucleotidyltransferase domain-containing protein [Microlunatus sp.]
MTITAEEALAPLPEPYHRLYERVLAGCEPDQRIRGLWLSGSLARGTADSGSDLDLLLALRDDDYQDFVAGWRSWLDTVTPTLLAKQVPGSRLILTSLTPQLCRLDAVFEPVSGLPESPFRTRITIIDRDGLDALLPAPVGGPGPDRDRIEVIISEFWRVQAIFPFMINGRQDLLAARSGVELAARLLYDLFVQTNQPQPPMGAKQFSSRLTSGQRELLESLPAFGADPTSLIEADLWLADAMASGGRAAAEQAGADYPDLLATTVRQQLDRMIMEIG